MSIEIERKFLVKNLSFLKDLPFESIVQGYLYIGKKSVARIRIIDNKKAFLTVKGKTGAISRLEYQYEIPLKEAFEMLETVCLVPVIKKKRYKINVEEHLWEIDVFEGENSGLVVAEIELNREDEDFAIPSWAGKEVSEDERYYNYSLVENPYSAWEESEEVK